MPKARSVTILGATGTIGKQTLDVISRHSEKFDVFALTANTKAAELHTLCMEYTPRYAVMLDDSAAEDLKISLTAAGNETEVLSGLSALEFVSAHEDVDIVMAAIVGAAGLKPSIAAAKSGKQILLANKETLVMSGSLFMQAVEEGGATLLPIDSEHNAIFQVMPIQRSKYLHEAGIRRILLTASGGPFRKSTLADLDCVTPEQALNHPNWVMGPKITIDSATLMNKGLEVIEAHWLFNATPEQIEVVVHPQSVIHSMVEYVDGSVLAQLGNPDMRTPIAFALGYPDRLESGVPSLDFFKTANFEFEAPDTNKFPCLRLAFDSLRIGGTAPAILNAANEVAVDAFLHHQIGFRDIPAMIESVLEQSSVSSVKSIENVIEVDQYARQLAKTWMSEHA
jgi:1-deoxy-D-xylulose-5-phosphate reductoisomerase